MRRGHLGWVVALAILVAPAIAQATPSTTYWAPSTPYMQPFGVLHVTYDTYFRENALYPVDLGLTVGVLPWDQLQMELGLDFFLPTSSQNGPLDAPVVFNGKVGAPEDVYFKGSPAWSFGAFGLGLKSDVTDSDVLYFMFGKTFDYIGEPEIGVYYGLNGNLFKSSDGKKEQVGVLAGWYSPAIKVPVLDHVQLAWDIQTGKNILGATGGGVYFFVTPAVSLLTGPVFFFDNDLQPGHDSWLWTMQLDIDVDVFSRLFKESD